jgi:hypothetical protein
MSLNMAADYDNLIFSFGRQDDDEPNTDKNPITSNILQS